MKEINVGDKKVRVRATPLALLFYKQEFKADLLGDLVKMEAARKDISKLDTVALLQLIWAMAKADSFGKPFPGFVEWLNELETFDMSDPTFLLAALEEAADGFFRGKAKQQKQRKQK